MSPAHASIGRRAASPGTIRLLDAANGLPAAAQTRSLRLLRTAYAGNCIQVRRSSDNTTSDIGFSSGYLDTATMLTFCGAGDGFVTKVYDQSGNARDTIYAATANQPRIVHTGAIETPHLINGTTGNSLACVRSIDNARGGSTNPFAAYTGTSATAAFVGAFGSSTETLSPRVISLLPSDTTKADFDTLGALLLHRNGNNMQWALSRNSTLYESEAGTAKLNQNVFSQINGATYSLTVDGTTVTTGSGLSAAFSVGAISDGYKSTGAFQSAVDSFWQEAIVWFTTLTSTQQTAVLASQQAYFSTAVAGGGGGGGTGRYNLEANGYTLGTQQDFNGTTLPAGVGTYNNGSMTSSAGAWMTNMVSVGPSVTGDGTNCLKIGVHRVTTPVNGYSVVGGAATLSDTSTFMKRGGAWEYRVRSDANQGTGFADLLWPQDPANWPTKGEIDVREIYSNSSSTNQWHQGESNFHLDTVQGSSRHLKSPASATHSPSAMTTAGNYQTDWTVWHIVQCIWNPDTPYNAVYIDGTLVGYTTDSSYIPSGTNAVPMRLTFQTEHYGATDASVSTTTAYTEVDYVKYYALP